MHLRKEVEGTYWYMSGVVQQMQRKFDKYWAEYSPILAMAIVFDPRYKFRFVEFCYKKLYGLVFVIEVDRFK